MEFKFDKKTEKPFLVAQNSIVIEVSKNFSGLTGFTIDELRGKSLIEIGEMLKINSQIFLDHINNNHSIFIFTKSLEAIEVNVSPFDNIEANEKIYTFVEIPNSKLDSKVLFVEQLYQDNIVGVAIHSIPELLLLKANQTYMDFQDFPNTDLKNCIGKPFKERVNGFEGSKAEMVFNEVGSSGKSSYLKEFEYEHFNRGITYWDSSLVPIVVDGKSKCIIETVTETTEKVEQRKLIEEQSKMITQKNELLKHQNEIILKQKEQLELKNIRLLNVIENLSEGVILADHEGKIIMTNPEAKKLFFQLDNAVVLGDAVKDANFLDMEGKAIPFENLPGFRALRGEQLKNVKVFVHQSNQEYFMEISSKSIYNNNGDLAMVILCFHDITEIIEQSKKIEEQKELLEAVIENMQDAFAIYDEKGNIILMNAEARKLYSQYNSPTEISTVHDGFQCFDLDNNFIPIENLPARRVFKGEKIRNQRIMVKHPEWTQYTESSAIPIFDDENNLVSAIVSHHDISESIKNQREIKNQQEQLIRVEKEKNQALEKTLVLKDEFFVNISHELKTPLNVIYSTVQLFNMYCRNESLDEKKDSIIKYIDSIKKNSYRLSKLINNIVDLSKIEAGFLELYLSNNNIVEVVEEVVMSVTDYIDDKGLNIIFDTDVEENIIACDPEKIERILLNLISNAIKFSNVGDEIFVDVKNKKEFVEISVKDNGIGIEENHLDMIFDRYKQVDKSLSRNAEGTGVGLSLVRSIVELHGGQIYVESEYGKGSKFTVVLPAKKVMQENMLLSNKMRNRNESVQVEFSDICS